MIRTIYVIGINALLLGDNFNTGSLLTTALCLALCDLVRSALTCFIVWHREVILPHEYSHGLLQNVAIVMCECSDGGACFIVGSTVNSIFWKDGRHVIQRNLSL